VSRVLGPPPRRDLDLGATRQSSDGTGLQHEDLITSQCPLDVLRLTALALDARRKLSEPPNHLLVQRTKLLIDELFHLLGPHAEHARCLPGRDRHHHANAEAHAITGV
jgi:hypothetical protein